jgi:hypothetical protein
MTGWRRVVDNKMRWQGEIDYKNRVIRINKVKSKKKSTIADTIVHEEMHRQHPKMWEKTVYKKTAEKVKRMSPAAKHKLYNRYK